MSRTHCGCISAGWPCRTFCGEREFGRKQTGTTSTCPRYYECCDSGEAPVSSITHSADSRQLKADAQHRVRLLSSANRFTLEEGLCSPH
ncbi:hypothetical protein NDU88_002210 [Pleurodeles waltl]|uniref:Uncharacterized protein n=1 Tax=Pleurodeles waltl TaxID=8319 RepID=A0AAV7UV19_PLEWA|nr:hypothetical protein NDU88_002210 [Pleurodeles waltl]